jgi:uncharacterized protein YukE
MYFDSLFFFGQMTAGETYTFAGILAMVLGGIGWLVRELIKQTPKTIDTVMDRLDKQEERRAEAMERLGADLKQANKDLAAELKGALNMYSNVIANCAASVQASTEQIESAIDEANRLQANYLAHFGGDPGNGKISKIGKTEKVMTDA